MNAIANQVRRQERILNVETGGPFVDLKAVFGLACRKAGIDGVAWHTLRHTFASRLVARGLEIVTVQQLLGHSTVTVAIPKASREVKMAMSSSPVKLNWTPGGSFPNIDNAQWILHTSTSPALSRTDDEEGPLR